MLFSDLKDSAREMWANSQKLVLDVRTEKLGVQIESNTIDRADRIDEFNPQKNRPLVTFSLF